MNRTLVTACERALMYQPQNMSDRATVIAWVKLNLLLHSTENRAFCEVTIPGGPKNVSAYFESVYDVLMFILRL